MRSRRIPIAGALFVALLLAISCGKPKDAKAAAGGAKTGKPHLAIHSSAASGFIPLTVQILGQLSGVSNDDANFADPGEKWLERHQDIVNKTERQPGEGRARGSVPKLSFEKLVTLDIPGTYQYQLMVKGADGQEVWSNWVTVRALFKQ